jgi:hypothetical protein
MKTPEEYLHLYAYIYLEQNMLTNTKGNVYCYFMGWDIWYNVTSYIVLKKERNSTQYSSILIVSYDKNETNLKIQRSQERSKRFYF